MAWIVKGKRGGETVELFDPGDDDSLFVTAGTRERTTFLSEERADQSMIQAIRDGVTDIISEEVPDEIELIDQPDEGEPA